MDNIILLILICAGGSLAANVILKKLEVESVIGYILTGMAVGFAFDLEHNASLEMIAEFGIVFLMFTIGLEFSPAKLKLMRKEVFLYGTLQMALTGAVFFALGHWVFGMLPQVNLIVSLALSLSSTAIVLNLLTKSRKINHQYGRNSVGVLLFQDIAVIPLLLMVSIFASTQESVPELLLDVLVDGVVVFLLLFFGGRFLTPHVMEQVIGTRSSELFVAALLLFVIGAAQLAHSLGFSYSLGAFLAGMVIAETRYKHQVEADLTPFRDLLLGVFFITVGMQVNPLFVANNLLFILALTVGLLAIKAVVLFSLIRLFHGTRTALKSALLLSQCGEFSFVVFETAQAYNLFMDPDRGQALVMAVVLTMMLTPFLFRFLDRICDLLVPEPAEPPLAVLESLEPAQAPRVIICGFGGLGQQVAHGLEAAKIPYIGIDHDSGYVQHCRENGMNVIYGNAAQRALLERLEIDQARAVVIAMSNEARILLVARALLEIAPHVEIRVCAANLPLKEELTRLGVTQPIDNMEQTARALVEPLATANVAPESRPEAH